MLCSNCYQTFTDDSLKTCPHCNFPLVDDCVIKNITIKNLFNSKDYEIDFSNDKNVSILIAPNGFGKSTIFNLINFIYNPSLELLEKISVIPFDLFTINFTNGGIINLKRNKNEVADEFKKYNFSLSGKLSENGRQTSVNIYSFFVEPLLEEYDLNKISSVVSNGIKNIFANTTQKINPLRGFYLPLKRLEITRGEKEQLKELNSHKNNEKLADIVSNAENLTKISVFNYFVANIVNIDNRYKTHLKTYKELESFLKVNPHNEKIKNMFEKSKDFIQNTTDQAAEIKERKKQLDLFCKIYNERNKQSGKTLSFNNKGFVIKNGKNIIPLENLSDGEKNDFLIFYHLIFSTKSLKKVSNLNLKHYSLIIIDEPEVSLHIEWQKTWLDYVLQICKSKKVQVIISTHSPYIVNANFDLYAEKKVTEHGEATN